MNIINYCLIIKIIIICISIIHFNNNTIEFISLLYDNKSYSPKKIKLTRIKLIDLNKIQIFYIYKSNNTFFINISIKL